MYNCISGSSHTVEPIMMKTILLVDDDEDARLICERELRGEGYMTRSAASGPEALELIDKNPQVDLIILDVRMAPVDGLKVLEQLRAKDVDIPVILYSDYSAYKRDFSSWFADAYLVKSSDLTKLKKKVKELLSLKKG